MSLQFVHTNYIRIVHLPKRVISTKRLTYFICREKPAFKRFFAIIYFEAFMWNKRRICDFSCSGHRGRCPASPISGCLYVQYFLLLYYYSVMHPFFATHSLTGIFSLINVSDNILIHKYYLLSIRYSDIIHIHFLT
jgi:hypothetical protein